MRSALPIVALGAAVGLSLLGLCSLPAPRSPAADQCQGSASPPLCRALLRLEGAPGPGPDLGHGPDLAELQDLPARPLLAGLAALREGQPVTAYRTCGAAAEPQGIDQGPALICQGRAALLLGWPARAAFLAGRALELEDDVAAHVLLALALEAQRDARGARLEFLRALDIEPENGEALQGLRRCGGTAPPDQREERGDRDGVDDDAAALAFALEVRHVL